MKKLYLIIGMLVATIGQLYAQNNSGWDWTSISGTTTNNTAKMVNDIATDASGNVYTTGAFAGTLTLGSTTVATSGDGISGSFDQDAFIAKYDATGNVQWLQRFGLTMAGSNQIGRVIIVDAGGNVYAGGRGMSINTVNSAFLNKYDTNGNLIWSKTDFPLYEVCALAIAADGNIIVHETGKNAKNIYKISSVDKSVIWTSATTDIGSNAGTTYKDFTDNEGNIYFSCFATGSGAVSVLGENYTISASPTSPVSYIVSVDKDGHKRWVQQVNGIQAVWFTVDADGNVYLPFGGGFGSTFQGVSTASPLGHRYFVLNKNGTVISHQLGMPYKGQFRVKADGIYGYENFQFTTIAAGTVKYGDYYFRTNTSTPTKAYGIVIKYDKTTDQPVWANSFEMTGQTNNAGSFNVLEIGNSGKIMVGGSIFTAIKTNSNTYTSTGSAGQTDFFVAQFNGNNIAAPAVTTWNGNAANNLWTDAANWSNGAPTGNEKTIIPSGMATYPTGITTANVTGRLEIASGVNIALPMAFVAPGGILNNGNLTVTGSGTFASGFASGASPLTGTGKVIFATGSPNGMANFNFPGDLEINQPGTNVGVLNVSVAGNLYITSGRLGVDVLTMTNPNASITGSATGFVYFGTLKRTVNANGTYQFPVGGGSNYAPLSLTLNNLIGPSSISVYYDYLQSNSGGVEPNINIGANNINTILNKNFWKISADAAITSGTYDVNLQASTYTNGVTDAARFVPLRREYRAAVWTFEGINGASTQTGETVNAGVTSNGIINVSTAGINKFGEFGVGIAASAVATGTTTGTTTWTGNAGDKVWATAANWDNGTPDGLKDAIIPSGISTYPETFTTSDNAKSLTINSGASIKLPTTLKISGTLTNNGSVLVNGNTGDYFKGFRATAAAAPATLKGNGKLVFTDVSPKGTLLDTVLLVNDFEVDRTIAFKLSNKTSGNVNIVNGTIGGTNVDGVESDLNMTNPNATLTVNAPTSYIFPRITRAVNSSGTYNFSIGNHYDSYMPLTIKTNNVTGITAYKVVTTSILLDPKLIVDGYPVRQFLNLGNQVGWQVVPTGTATGGTIDLDFEARGYTNGVTDVSRYVFLRRASTTGTWTKVENAIITENAGVIGVSVQNISSIFSLAEFAVGIKGEAVTWNGSVSSIYTDATNWTPNTVPTSANKVIFNAGATNYPASYSASAMVVVGAGTTLTLPSNIDFGAGIENNGIINLSTTGTFYGFNNGNTPVSGIGKLVLGETGPSAISMSSVLGNSIEINRAAGVTLSQALTLGGNIIMTNGKLSGNYDLTMSNPDATVIASSTAYIATKSLIRTVNTSGIYTFPIGTTARYAPATVILNSVVGPTKITSSFVTTSTGSIQPNTIVDGKGINRILDAGTWTLTPDVALTSGSYNVVLEGRGYTNGAANATNYVVLKRQNPGFNYQFFGTNVNSTETGGVITATANGITGFSDFAIGVTTSYETKWTGTAGDKKWTTATNWDNGVPSSIQKAVFDNTGTNFPDNFTSMNKTVDKVEVGAGITLKLPTDLNPANGIVNNGTIELIGSSFSGFYVTGIFPTGTGKLLFTTSGPSSVSISTSNTLNQNIEINRSTGISFSAKVNGSFNVVSGTVTTPSGITLTNADATITCAPGTYIAGNLTRAVNSSGVYSFPVGSATAYTPVNLNLHSITGPTTIMVGLFALPLNPQPSLVVGRKTVNGALNTGIWVIAPNSAITNGSYDIGIETNKYTNGVPEASSYALIKQTSYGGSWANEGTIVVSTQVGGTDNSGVVSDGLVNAGSTGLTVMATANYFAIGIYDPTTLPVKLVDFTIKAMTEVVLLNWKTANELNNKGFEIYRSGDDGIFVKLDEIPAVHIYTYTDKKPLNGNNYYKLVQVDNNGKTTELGVRKIAFNLTPSTLRLFPNPVSKSFKLINTGNTAILARLYDFSGREVAVIKGTDNEFYLPAQLNNGIYLVKVAYQSGTVSQHKIVVNR